MTRPTHQHPVPEAVAVFDDADSLYAALAELQTQGFNRSEINLLADEAAVEEKLGDNVWRAEDLEDEPEAPRATPTSPASIGEAQGTLLGIPAYLAAVVTAGALTTAGGPVTAAIVGTTLAGGAGLAVGAALARLLGKRHAEYLQNQIEHGGLLLWVRTWSEEEQEKAVEILRRCSGRDVHVHDWTVTEWE